MGAKCMASTNTDLTVLFIFPIAARVSLQGTNISLLGKRENHRLKQLKRAAWDGIYQFPAV